MLALLRSGANPFSPRFRGVAHNCCKTARSPNAIKLVTGACAAVLSGEEAESLGHVKDYRDKLAFLSRRPLYSKDLDRAFIAKNLINVLNALSKVCPALATHRLSSMAGHPDGPGARKFYSLLPGSLEDSAARPLLLTGLASLHPRGVEVDGVGLVGLRVEADADCMDEEFVQYNACAAWRGAGYISTGRLPVHLKRKQVT